MIVKGPDGDGRHGDGGRKESLPCLRLQPRLFSSVLRPVQSWEGQQRRADGRRGGDGEDDGDHHHQLT